MDKSNNENLPPKIKIIKYKRPKTAPNNVDSLSPE